MDRELWRVMRTSGPHVLPWGLTRRYGPLTQMRWDPHPAPRGEHIDVGVLYAALDITTTLAEAFAATRCVETTAGNPHLVSWVPTRPLRLLDLTGGWALRNRAAHSLAGATKDTCRSWAREICTAFADLDGLCAVSTMTGHPSIVLFARAEDSIPDSPATSRPLTDPTVLLVLSVAAAEIGYSLL